MSKAIAFLGLLQETPRTRAELAEESGEDVKTVTNRLKVLRVKGLVKRTGDGWVKVIKANGAAEPMNDTPAPPPKAKRKKSRSKRVSKAAEPREEEALFSFFIDDELDLQICRKDGVGEAAIVPREDALRLRDFLNQVGDVMRLA